ncbi:MAG: hypothetical protein ACI36Y_07505 [Coriobacteriales bacterium]
MDALDRALDEALRRQREGAAKPAPASASATASAALTRAAVAKPAAVDPWSPEAVLRAANEDDDLYDPYSDYMDALARSSYEEPCADPWR